VFHALLPNASYNRLSAVRLGGFLAIRAEREDLPYILRAPA